jgi:hypothetical protein
MEEARAHTQAYTRTQNTHTRTHTHTNIHSSVRAWQIKSSPLACVLPPSSSSTPTSSSLLHATLKICEKKKTKVGVCVIGTRDPQDLNTMSEPCVPCTHSLQQVTKP